MNSFIKLVTALAMVVSMSSHAVDFNGSELQKYFEGKISKEEIAQQLTEEPGKFDLNFTVLLQSVPEEVTYEQTRKIIQLEDEVNRHLIKYNSSRDPDFKLKIGGAVIGAVVGYVATYRGMGAHQLTRGDFSSFAGKALVATISLGVGAAVGGVVYVSIDQLLEKPHILPSTTRLLNYIE